MMRVATLATAGLLLLAACEGGHPESTSIPIETPTYPIDTADSKSAKVGKPYRWVLSTHCGIDFAIDFDGSFWQAVVEDRRAFRRGNLKDLREPDRGTMTLVSENLATYASNNGPELHYERSETTRPDTACL